MHQPAERWPQPINWMIEMMRFSWKGRWLEKKWGEMFFIRFSETANQLKEPLWMCGMPAPLQVQTHILKAGDRLARLPQFFLQFASGNNQSGSASYTFLQNDPRLKGWDGARISAELWYRGRAKTDKSGRFFESIFYSFWINRKLSSTEALVFICVWYTSAEAARRTHFQIWSNASNI